MNVLLPVALAVPLLGAAVLGLTGKFAPKHASDFVGFGAAFAPVVLTAIVTARIGAHVLVYWFGGWRPLAGQFPVGIAFAPDRIGVGLACFASILLTAALIFSWRYLDDEHYLYLALMLAFGGAMVGFSLTGDIFNLFVFFELMSVAAFALTAYKIEEPSPLQGSFNFAISNTLGALLVLFGIALLYGRTGSLNLAEIGRRLTADGRHDGLVVVAFALIACGFLVKAAMVPFHFWLADAHATAPAPVCLLFSGVMVELGIYAVARIYWVVFSGVLEPYAHGIGDVLLGVGAVTAVLGAVMCGMQRHIKRLLAYSTISHSGCILMGVALLSPDGLAGSAVYVLAHGLAKGALFLCGGVLLVANGEIDELLLQGRGRRLPVTATTWFIGALALASPPFLGTFSGHALIEDSASAAGRWWVPIVFAFATIGSTGAVIRVGLRVFVGIGDEDDPLLSDEPQESAREAEDPSLGLMQVVALVLALGGLAVGAITPLADRIREAAETFTDRAGYSAVVLRHAAQPHVAAEHWTTTTSSVVWSVVTLLGAIVIGVSSLYRARAPEAVMATLGRMLQPLRNLHSGHIGDYVAWLTFGTAVIGGLFAVAIR